MTIAVLLAMASIAGGCSPFKAANQPDAKNLSLFKRGTPRDELLAEFGAPITSEVHNGVKQEVFKFVDGYSSGVKAGRAVFHGAADVVTLGLWEIVATPTEGAFSGDERAFQVSYNDADEVKDVIQLK